MTNPTCGFIEHGPGQHMAHVMIDGAADTPGATENDAPSEPDAVSILPNKIDDAAMKRVREHRSTSTFELDLSPFGEKC